MFEIPAKWLWIIEKKTDKKNVRCFSSLSLEDHFSHGILMKRIKNRKIMKIKKKLVIDYLLSWLQWHGWLWELNVVNKVWRNNERYPKLFAKVTWENLALDVILFYTLLYRVSHCKEWYSEDIDFDFCWYFESYVFMR